MTRALGCLVVAFVVACGRADDAPDGMTAEEHARMLGARPADSAAPGTPVRVTAEQVRALGVTFTAVERGPLSRSIRTVGQVVPPESGLADVTARVEGYVEQLRVSTTGAVVRQGEPLLMLYSPMLVAAQEELLTAVRLLAATDSGDGDARRNAASLLEAARRRLSLWDISSGQIEQIERSGTVTRVLAIEAPVTGVVLEKMVVQGQAVMPGMRLYRLADLSTVWVDGAVFEQDLAAVRVGLAVRAEVNAFPGRAFAGRVSFIAPTVDPESRTTNVRVVVRNPGGVLKPGMFATLFLESFVGADVLHVPADAVVMTGERNVVFVIHDGALEAREIVLGQRAGDRFEVRSGLTAGDRIASSANFLIDAESRLRTGGGMPGMPEHQP